MALIKTTKMLSDIVYKRPYHLCKSWEPPLGTFDSGAMDWGLVWVKLETGLKTYGWVEES